MSFATEMDVMCDCKGCPGCKEDDRQILGECGAAESLGICESKTEATKLARENGWSVSRRDGQDHARCSVCKGKQETA